MTVARITEELGARGFAVEEKSVYRWLAGTSVPRPDRAMTMVEISGGRLKLDDVYQHQREVRGDDGRSGSDGSGTVASGTTARNRGN